MARKPGIAHTLVTHVVIDLPIPCWNCKKTATVLDNYTGVMTCLNCNTVRKPAPLSAHPSWPAFDGDSGSEEYAKP